MNDQTALEEIVLNLQEDFNDDLFNYLIKRVEPLIMSTVKRYYHPQLDKEDLYQECVIALHRAVLKYKIETKAYFISFFRTSMKYHVLQIIRAYNTQKRGSGNSWLDISLNQETSSKNEVSRCNDKYFNSKNLNGEEFTLVKEIFVDYLSSLDEKEGKYINLCMTGHSVKEISEKTGSSIAQTRYLHRKCRQKFDDLLLD